ncbi:ABC-three component system middle component 6 [Solirubrum puertoriconensis]|uniref:Uncharacterized protein n=1 Tax=Solirubrum puertoriconensis TaxID=1751427 RepID=A0A9X0HJ74_SOLP1|nr:ABC-three component system middle component 6 [Solirubrum puertoriconensis]KUG06913.1 hypothetical protein ASU33_06200 [Solirubrum puertoriconensis]
MITPTKHGDITKNALVVAAEVIKLLKKDDYNIDELHKVLAKKKEISLYLYNDVLLFLYLVDAIELVQDKVILIEKKDENVLN